MTLDVPKVLLHEFFDNAWLLNPAFVQRKYCGTHGGMLQGIDSNVSEAGLGNLSHYLTIGFPNTIAGVALLPASNKHSANIFYAYWRMTQQTMIGLGRVGR
jgi:hypothetical protein